MKYDLRLRSLAVVLMLAGAVMLVAADTGVVGFALVAIGIALVGLLETEKRRRGSVH